MLGRTKDFLSFILILTKLRVSSKTLIIKIHELAKGSVLPSPAMGRSGGEPEGQAFRQNSAPKARSSFQGEHELMG